MFYSSFPPFFLDSASASIPPTPLDPETSTTVAEEGQDGRCQSGGNWQEYFSATDFTSSSGASQTFEGFYDDGRNMSQAYARVYPPDESVWNQIDDVERSYRPEPSWCHSPSHIEGSAQTVSNGFFSPSDASYMSSVAQPQGYVSTSMVTPAAGQPLLHPGLAQSAPSYSTNDACPSALTSGMTNLSTPFHEYPLDESAHQTPLWPHTPLTPFQEQIHDLGRPEENYPHFTSANTHVEGMAPALYLMPPPQNLYAQGLHRVPDQNYNYFPSLDAVAMSSPSVPPLPISMSPSPSHPVFGRNPDFWQDSQYHAAGSSAQWPQPYNATGYSPTSSGTSTPNSSCLIWSPRSSGTTPATSPEPLDAPANLPATGPVRTQRRERGSAGSARRPDCTVSPQAARNPVVCPGVSVPLLPEQLTQLVAEAQKEAIRVQSLTCEWDACGTDVALGDLRDHLQTTHGVGYTNAKSYCRWTGPCKGKTNEMNGSALKKHVLSNKHAKASVTCPLCDKRFARGDSLRRHLDGQGA
ncbi:hypothetical protein C8R45DRAFT_248257 [Mycena sanguinolenta]|nr:hypothetical protein C8R45DRAFT_248257 [Mycena sanguinolenta]